MFHLLSYKIATGGAVTLLDMAAAVDPVFSQRNGHYIFTDPLKLAWMANFGATLTEMSMQSPTLNAIGLFNSYPVNLSLTVPAVPRVDFYLNNPLLFPMNEELQFKASDSASENVANIIAIMSPEHNFNIPRGIPPVPQIKIKVTASVTLAAYAWSTLAAVTFEQSLRGGTYALVGAQWVCANALAFRHVFPRQKPYNGRFMRPGVLAQNAFGDTPLQAYPDGAMFMGEHGRFSTFEPFQVEVMGSGTATVTAQGIIDLVRISEDANVVY